MKGTCRSRESWRRRHMKGRSQDIFRGANRRSGQQTASRSDHHPTRAIRPATPRRCRMWGIGSKTATNSSLINMLKILWNILAFKFGAHRQFSLSAQSRMQRSPWVLQGVQKDRPFDDIRVAENAVDRPRIVSKEGCGLVGIARVDDDQNATQVSPVASAQNRTRRSDASPKRSSLMPIRSMMPRYKPQSLRCSSPFLL